MSQVNSGQFEGNGQFRASAFRAQRFVAWQLQQLKSRYGELPRHALPGAVPATDSAVAPRRSPVTRVSSRLSAPRPDPEYERRLEQLAQSMLAAASASPPPVAEPPPPAARQAQAESAHPEQQARTEPTRLRRPSASRRAAVSQNDASERREPVLEPLETPAVSPQASPRPRGLRKTAITGAAVAGVLLGISLAWWFGELDKMDRAMSGAVASSGASGVQSQQSSEAGHEAPLALARPRQDESRTPLVITPAPSGPGAVQSVTPEDLPEQKAEQQPAPKAESKPEIKPEIKSEANPAAKAAVPAEVSKPNVATVDARKGKSRDSARAQHAQPAKRPHPAAVASAKNSKKPAPQVEPRDDDIDRLRSQAYSETSRDRERKVLPNAKPANPEGAVAVTPISTNAAESRLSHKKELAQCEKVEGLFFRERCKWRICKEQWGSNGCPSFPQQGVRF